VVVTGEEAMEKPTIAVHSLEIPEYREELRKADVVFGVDVNTQREFLVYGRATLEQIVTSGQGEHLRVARVELDQETNELEFLLAVIQTLRGHHDYQASTDER
jgi:hypothetical protein